MGHEGEEEQADGDKKYWIRRKVELPNFDGSDPLRWLIRAEKFFAIHEVKPDSKVEMACVSMDGPAVHWFQCMKLRWPNLSWEKFRVELMKRYCGRCSGNVYEQMASLKQLGSIAKYVEEYEKATTRLSTMSEDQQLGFFMNGLRVEIKRRVRIHDPEDLHRAMQLALDVEEELI